MAASRLPGFGGVFLLRGGARLHLLLGLPQLPDSFVDLEPAIALGEVGYEARLIKVLLHGGSCILSFHTERLALMSGSLEQLKTS